MTEQEAFIEEYRFVYLHDPDFKNIDDLNLYTWWTTACKWQRQQDINYCRAYYSIENIAEKCAAAISTQGKSI